MISFEEAHTVVSDPAATDAQLEEVFRLFPTAHVDLLARADLPQGLVELIANTSPSLEAQHQARVRLGLADTANDAQARPAVLPEDAYAEANPITDTGDSATTPDTSAGYTPRNEQRKQYRSRTLTTAVSESHGPLSYEARLNREQANTTGALLAVAVLLIVLISAVIFAGFRLINLSVAEFFLPLATHPASTLLHTMNVV